MAPHTPQRSSRPGEAVARLDSRVYHVLGVPLRSGSLYPGSENDAQAYRDAGLLSHLGRDGRRAVDDGDVAVPSYLPHHAVPPIRSWPGPRIAWECVAERVAPYLARPAQLTVIGWSMPSASGSDARSLSLGDLRRAGAREAARRTLEEIPASASILVHLDIDVLQKAEMPAAYFPHDEGLRLAEAAELLAAIFADPRVRLIEVSEYAALRDLERRHVGALIDVLARALPA
jgi:arginase family enzyme